uniref:tRNA (adenine(58)-N(1))-methyltransferase n=1 Tax=Stegastes partitus TaxID=144197 RepID=A0A3B4Z4G6_9TELE
MAVYAPSRLLFMHRLVTVCTSSQRHVKHRDVLVKLTKSRREIRTFSTSCVRCNNNEADSSDSSHLSTKPTSRRELPPRSRRPLSPLERISSLLPQDALSPEVMQLREQRHEPDEDPDTQPSVTHSTQEGSGHKASVNEDSPETLQASDAAEEPNAASLHHHEGQVRPTLPGENLLAFGEMLVAEYRKKKRVEFKKMFQLDPGVRLQSSWGTIPHNDIAGQPAGRFLKTNRGVSIFIRRASLEDYVLLMRRGAAISYPKDAATMLMMMDVTEGDCVLESGSGSGAMSLFLSRAVGSKGSVLSVEVREDHHKRAVKNYERWRKSWSVRRGEEWPDNVRFHIADLGSASSLLAGRGFHAVALDMVNPQLVLHNVLPHLHPGAVCAVYLANVTQVIDLLESLRCSSLPLLCEQIMEFPSRDWLVVPALKKDGSYCTRNAPFLGEDLRQEDDTSDEPDKEESSTEEDPDPAFGSVPYIARPHPEQMSHTGQRSPHF